jgi:hypothetical protein
MVTVLWTSNINVLCKSPTHVYEDKIQQKKWVPYLGKCSISFYTEYNMAQM